MSYNSTSCADYYDGQLGPSLATACSGSQFYLFMSILDALIRNKETVSGSCSRIKSIDEPDEVYDFIVVGVGAAGAVVAGRLSENPEWTVLGLEAGPQEPAAAGIPSFAGGWLGTGLNWNYKTTDERHACLSTNGSCTWPAGKNLGGSTAHNHMVYIRGNPTDYNNWAAEGNEGWDWKEVKKVFKRAEDNLEIERVGRKHHGTGAEELGYGNSDDLNGDKVTGFAITQATSKNGVRRSSASMYLWPVRDRENLHISLGSFVTRVIIEDGKAVGVEYFKDGKLRRVRANKEVILSAGTVRSPFILLHSGIGCKDHLKSVGINLVKDLPGVGYNVQDHVSIKINFTVNRTDEYDNNWKVASEYLLSQTGPMSGTGLPQMVGMLASDETAPDYPDIEIFTAAYAAGCGPGEIHALRSEGRRPVILIPTLLHPKSRGRVSLASNDPLQYPKITANYLSDPADTRLLLKAIGKAMAFTTTKALRAYDLTLAETPVEACSDHTFLSDEYWACVAQQNTAPEHHQVGSCKMGPSSDPMAVVDHRLRVYGIEGLRVADASIMPKVTSGNTAAPTMMIGERTARFIKQDWR